MRFMKKIDGKECNKAKWESIAAEFDKSKDVKKKRFKKIVMIEKKFDNWKKLCWLKKIVIIEKDCD